MEPWECSSLSLAHTDEYRKDSLACSGQSQVAREPRLALLTGARPSNSCFRPSVTCTSVTRSPVTRSSAAMKHVDLVKVCLGFLTHPMMGLDKGGGCGVKGVLHGHALCPDNVRKEPEGWDTTEELGEGYCWLRACCLPSPLHRVRGLPVSISPRVPFYSGSTG